MKLDLLIESMPVTSQGWRAMSDKPVVAALPTEERPDVESCELVSESTPTPADAAETAAA